ncbi:MAG: cell division protein SepF [Hamadaea sp.]|uniref:cell division protein SepF n=1 Tax=Hamadaea sp. TaxID=2024425 RepID=UPI0017C4F80B|nr:cell division protein SepF [Hamadaea sp.]NUR70978.1 cell division protein SepF [Hamadaea sp.]NUT21654.1 cell division protein SepF [Hamadaea sp.]
MSALRKAGVWLGLVEDDDERDYDDRGYSSSSYRDRGGYRDSRRTATRDSGYDEFDDEEDEDDLPAVPRSRYSERLREDRGRADDRGRGETSRSSESRYDGARSAGAGSTVRPITRPVSPSAPSTPAATATPSTSSSRSGGLFGTRENLALAPEAETAAQIQPRSAVPAAEEDRRYQITTLHPTTYNEARTIGEHFRDGTPVIMNLTEMDEADAKRLVDFAAGLAFGLRGTIERVTHRVFLLSPANVQVTAEEKAKIAEGGYHHT